MNTPAQTTETIKESLAAVVGKKNVLDKPEIPVLPAATRDQIRNDIQGLQPGVI